MNVNPLLMQLEEITGFPVVPDLYEGDSDKWIVFVYADERGELFADNDEQYTTVKLYVSFYCPSSFNHMAHKKLIKKALKDLGFNVESISSHLEDTLEGTDRLRRTLFEVNITSQEE